MWICIFHIKICNNQHFFLIFIYNILVGDGRLGYPEKAPYDAIHVGAAAKEMPQAVRKNLIT